MFGGHIIPFLCCLIGLPIIAGSAIRKKPFVTIAILTFGSVPPLNHIPPISIGLAPLYWTWIALHEATQPILATLMIELPLSLLFAAVAFVVMFIPYSALVFLGWHARHELTKHHYSVASRPER